MTRIFLVACITLGVVALAGEPVAFVNGEPVSREELDRETGLADIVFFLSRQFPGFAQSLLLSKEGKALLARYERDVLEKIILQRIQLHEARKRGLTVDEDEVSRRTQDTLDQIYAHYGLSEREFAAQLLAQGYTLDEYREDIARKHREKLLIAELKAALRAEITVSEEEIKAYYDEDPGRFVDDSGETLPLDEVRERIAALLRLDKEEAHWQDWIMRARSEANVEIKL